LPIRFAGCKTAGFPISVRNYRRVNPKSVLLSESGADSGAAIDSNVHGLLDLRIVSVANPEPLAAAVAEDRHDHPHLTRYLLSGDI
jgi:hypothetical protein